MKEKIVSILLNIRKKLKTNSYLFDSKND